MEQLIYEDELWLDNLLEKCKPLWNDLQQTTFKRYREIGQHIIESGYTKGEWHSKHKTKFLEEMKISKSTFSCMTQLGEMGNEEFSDTVGKFTSLHEWVHQSKSIKESLTETIYMDARYFDSKEEFENFIKGLKVKYQGLFFRIIIESTDKEELNRRFADVKRRKF